MYFGYSQWNIIILICVSTLAIVSHLISKGKINKLPSISNDLFLIKLKHKFNEIESINNEIILKEREYIAKELGIKIEKIDIDISFEEIRKFDFMYHYSIGISHLSDDLFLLYKKYNIENEYKFPDKTGELIRDILMIKINNKNTYYKNI